MHIIETNMKTDITTLDCVKMQWPFSSILSALRKADGFVVKRHTTRPPDKLRRFAVMVEVPNWIVNDKKVNLGAMVAREAVRRFKCKLPQIVPATLQPVRATVYDLRVTINATSQEYVSRGVTAFLFNLYCKIEGAAKDDITTPVLCDITYRNPELKTLHP